MTPPLLLYYHIMKVYHSRHVRQDNIKIWRKLYAFLNIKKQIS